MSPLLSIHGLAKSFGGVQAVKGVSFGVGPGEAVALIGPNGAGKTTCFNMTAASFARRRDHFPSGPGHRGPAAARHWRLGIGRTFQVAAIFPVEDVRENVQVGLASHAGRGFNLARPLAGLAAERADAAAGPRRAWAAQANRACGLLAPMAISSAWNCVGPGQRPSPARDGRADGRRGARRAGRG
jgi:branched-chain amino acid transport system ATP-binding protein